MNASAGASAGAGTRPAQAEAVQADAGLSDACAGAVPADLALACGIFGNVSDTDVRGTVAHLPELCAKGAMVIWTRGRFEPDLTPAIRGWFGDCGFEELTFTGIPDSTAAVGVHRLVGEPQPLAPGTRYFTFLEKERRPSTLARRGR